MKCLLVGYPGSQVIIKASKYLADKYLPASWERIYLNYTGEINGWAAYLVDFLNIIPDENIIFALDDYLIADYLDIEKFNSAAEEMGGQTNVVCIKLCNSTKQEHEEYPVTTQYCIWNREYLIWLLSKVDNPWSFEINGSRIFDKICLHRQCLEYFTNSSISGRWDGVNLEGLKDEDIEQVLPMIPKDVIVKFNAKGFIKSFTKL